MTSGGRAIPERPDFSTESERLVWEALRASLRDGEVLIHGLRFSDRHSGDVEVDIILLSPTLGAAVIEVKGGHVQFENGVWTTTNGSGAIRRIHPTDQARRAKHALRRYLDRQPAWPWGLLRSQWFLAAPFTELAGDLAPDAPREQLIGQGELPYIQRIIDDALEGATREPPTPSDPWVDLAVDLLLASPYPRPSDRVPDSPEHNSSVGAPTGVLMAITVLASAALGTGLTLAFGWWGALACIIAIAVTLLGIARRISAPYLRISTLVATAGVTAVVSCGAVLLLMPESTIAKPATHALTVDGNKASLMCSEAYDPCVLEKPEDRDCPGIGFRVKLLGSKDPYELDLDSDGIGCESYPEKPGGEPTLAQ